MCVFGSDDSDQYTAGKYVEHAAAMLLRTGFPDKRRRTRRLLRSKPVHAPSTTAPATEGYSMVLPLAVLSSAACSRRWSSLLAAAPASPSPPRPGAHYQVPLRSVLPRSLQGGSPWRRVPSLGGNRLDPSNGRRRTDGSRGARRHAQESTRISSSRRYRPRDERAPITLLVPPC